MSATSDTRPVTFGLIGAGWRTEFFLRVARALPDRFRVGGVVVRDAEKGHAVAAAWGVPTYRTPDDLLHAASPAFMVLSVPRSVAPDLLAALVAREIPVLVETPPAADLDGLRAVWQLAGAGARVQVAEQYPFQPLHAARLALVRAGRLGIVSQAQVSAAHDYHGLGLLRGLLGVGFANATITARAFEAPIVDGPDRAGDPATERVVPSRQVVALLDWGDRWGVYDFAGAQYFSWIRSPRVLVRGERGEIHDERVAYLEDFRTPVTYDFVRQVAGEGGNLEGFHLKGILAGEKWVYRNPFVPARLSDDEIAVATCMEKMAVYAAGGASFYGLAEAAQDHYLGLMIAQAAHTGADVRTASQPWA